MLARVVSAAGLMSLGEAFVHRFVTVWSSHVIDKKLVAAYYKQMPDVISCPVEDEKRLPADASP
jgi:hypothetical protein